MHVFYYITTPQNKNISSISAPKKIRFNTTSYYLNALDDTSISNESIMVIRRGRKIHNVDRKRDEFHPCTESQIPPSLVLSKTMYNTGAEITQFSPNPAFCTRVYGGLP